MTLKHVLAGTAMLALSATPAALLYAQAPFTIKGQLGKDQQGMLSIQYVKGKSDVKDSIQVVNGAFELKGQVQEPIDARLIFMPTDKTIKGQFTELFLDPATTITIAGDGNLLSAKIKGGSAQDDFLQLMEAYKPISEKGMALDKQLKQYQEQGDEEKGKEVAKELGGLRMQRRQIQETFASTHPDSYVAFGLWKRKVDGFLPDPITIETEFNKFSPRIRNSVDGKKLTGRLAIAKNLVPGKPAPDFTLNDPMGKPVSLSSFKGKNVVLLFWARNFIGFDQFSFAVNKISRQCKDDNLVILSVFYAGEHYNWNTVLEEAGMIGANIINVQDESLLPGNKTQSEAVKKYDLSGGVIAQCYVIDEKGTILSRDINLFGEDYIDTIKKLIKK